MFRLLLTTTHRDEMLAHLVTCLPAEGCGLFAGTIESDTGRVTHHFPLRNALSSPTEYQSDPRDMLLAHKAMRVAGVDVLAVYHSHPTSDPIPSRRDHERNYSEQVVNIIVGLAKADPDVRAWWLKQNNATIAELIVEDGVERC